MQFMASERQASRSSGGQFLDDHESLAALIGCMPRQELDDYKTYGALSIEACFPNRRMVVYTLRGNRPTDIEMLQFGDIEISRVGGAHVTVRDSQGEFSIGFVPTRYRARDLFLHIPQNFVFKWKGKQVPGGKIQFVPHYAVLVKTRSKEVHQVEGHTYCSTFNDFRKRWPDLDLRY